jgi:hypothetical protein
MCPLVLLKSLFAMHGTKSVNSVSLLYRQASIKLYGKPPFEMDKECDDGEKMYVFVLTEYSFTTVCFPCSSLPSITYHCHHHTRVLKGSITKTEGKGNYKSSG